MTKISAASLVAAATDLMKMPTGEVGDLALNVGQIKANVIVDTNALYDVTGAAANAQAAAQLYADNLVPTTITAAQKYDFAALPDANYTLALTDAVPLVKFLTLNSASARNVTLPNNTTAAIPIGQGPIALLNLGSADITILAEAGATVENYSTVFTVPPGSMATFIKRAINTWRLENITAAVPASRTIAGIDLVDNITAAELTTALNGWTKVYLAADQVFASTTYADLTGVLAPCVANVPLEIRAVLFYDSANAGEGCKADFNGPTLTDRSIRSDTMTSTSAMTNRCTGGAYATLVSGANATIAGGGGSIQIYQRIVTSVTGSQQIQFGTETGGTNVTVLGGSTVATRKSYLEYRNL